MRVNAVLTCDAVTVVSSTVLETTLPKYIPLKTKQIRKSAHVKRKSSGYQVEMYRTSKEPFRSIICFLFFLFIIIFTFQLLLARTFFQRLSSNFVTLIKKIGFLLRFRASLRLIRSRLLDLPHVLSSTTPRYVGALVYCCSLVVKYFFCFS